jgi:glycolate oxidase FAD binding subunit
VSDATAARAARGTSAPAVTPASVAAPATPAAVCDAVRAAHAARGSLRVVGRGGWLDAGRPVRARGELRLGGLRGVVAYTPGDLTITALAGTTLAEVAEITRAEGQFLALDPAGGDAGSLGATVATASAGPLAHAFGTPRDNVLGVEFVTGAGALVRGGGRVVKNVAGFDLTRLVTGAWGTLGVLTEVTLRLRALPEADLTLAVAAPGAPAALDGWLARLRQLPLAPWALELVDARWAAALGAPAGDGAVLVARLAGNEPSVAAQEAALRTLGDAVPLPAGAWDALRAGDPAGAAALRLSAPPRELAATWSSAVALATAAGGATARLRATVGRGVVRCVLAGAPADALAAACRGAPVAGTRIFESLPAALWPVLAPSAVETLLARRTRDAFDPGRVLNPGILGEGAGA